MQSVPDESKIVQIFNLLGKIDDDKDGQLKVDDVLKVRKMEIYHNSVIYD